MRIDPELKHRVQVIRSFWFWNTISTVYINKMNPRFWFSAVFLMTRIGLISAANQVCNNENSVAGTFLKGHTFKTLWVKCPLECAILCDQDIRCQSLNFIFGGNICELNNRTKEARPEDFLPDSTRFYRKRAFNRVPLGSIQELPAESCAEIEASEGYKVADSKHWIYSDENGGQAIQATCQEVWQKINEDPVCFGARDDQYGAFNMTKTGNVKAMKLVHRSGSIKCNSIDDASYWSCTNLNFYANNTFMTIITNANKKALLPTEKDMETVSFCNQKKHFYVLEGINQGSSELVLSSHSSPLRLLKNQELQIWYGQDWINCSEYDSSGKADNTGTTCVDVFAWYM
ncbi:uncharacterized protein [Montipora capricornis]|uniref:uncharacterized protein isoform X1 n=2 Tax=Montipora capricornis TaxID=246305 RepID=UPI0035F13EC4